VTTVRLALPSHLRTLAGVTGHLTVRVPDRPTLGDVLDELEVRYPVLRGTIRDHGTHQRRAFMRYFAGEEDLSHVPADTPLPPPVVDGDAVFRIVGAIAGG
jgi:molybdopterin converting factor small subunit